MKHIGGNIRKVRVLLEVKQAIMAKMLNLSVNSYGKIERNEVELTPERLVQIAQALGVESKHIINLQPFLDRMKQKKPPNN